MASVLRQIVAGPRVQHPEANLDLCYVTDNGAPLQFPLILPLPAPPLDLHHQAKAPPVIATSGPSRTYPSRAYRNPLDALVRFLDAKHGVNWAIWEFRAEGTGYSDSEVYGRIWHFPWPDHHPPPFGLLVRVVGSMRDWLKGDAEIGLVAQEEGKENKRLENQKNISRSLGERVVVVHCKAGKGRSGTAACSYLMAEEGWSKEEALRRFTERRMRPGFGAGVSIPSQLRWIEYVERWIKGGKTYVDQRAEVVEVHVWGLRDGVKIAVEGFVDDGKIIKCFHVFRREERDDLGEGGGQASINGAANTIRRKNLTPDSSTASQPRDSSLLLKSSSVTAASNSTPDAVLYPSANANVMFRPPQPIIVPTNDINIAVERRSRAGHGWSMVTSVAHVWFNCFFEGNGPEHPNRRPDPSGVFTIDFDAMDGIKGSSRKGTRAFDKLAVVWRIVPDKMSPENKLAETEGDVDEHDGQISETQHGKPVSVSSVDSEQKFAAQGTTHMARQLGLQAEGVDSANVSETSSLVETGFEERNVLNTKNGRIPDMSVADNYQQGENDEATGEDGTEGVDHGLKLPIL